MHVFFRSSLFFISNLIILIAYSLLITFRGCRVTVHALVYYMRTLIVWTGQIAFFFFLMAGTAEIGRDD